LAHEDTDLQVISDQIRFIFSLLAHFVVFVVLAQFKTHPNVNKTAFTNDMVVSYSRTRPQDLFDLKMKHFVDSDRAETSRQSMFVLCSHVYHHSFVDLPPPPIDSAGLSGRHCARRR
jgi:hypothetical protein